MFNKELQPFRASATFQVGGVARNIFSVGKLHDEDFDIVISKRLGTYVGKEGERGYRAVPKERLRNTFGVRVHVDDSVSEASQDDTGEGDPPASSAKPHLELLDDTPVPLGLGSYVRDLRRRLHELGGNTSGTKAVMWARLRKIEKHNKEKTRLRNALRERQEDMIAGVAPHEIRGCQATSAFGDGAQIT
eukprot:6491333-Amphidinium_carterae.1